MENGMKVKIIIEIGGKTSWKKVEAAYVGKYLAATPAEGSFDDEFVVTHLNTGRKFGPPYLSKDEAIAHCKALDKYSEWGEVKSILKQKNSPLAKFLGKIVKDQFPDWYKPEGPLPPSPTPQ